MDTTLFFKSIFGAFRAFMMGTEIDWKGGRERGRHAVNDRETDSNLSRLRQGIQTLYMGRICLVC